MRFLQRLRETGWTAGGYLLLVLFFIWPLPMSLVSRCWGHQWELWGNLWAIDLLSRGEAAPLLPRLFFPVGFNMLQDMGHFLIPWLGGCLAAWLPLALAYNLLLIGLLVGGCLAAHYFAACLGAERGARVVAAAIFACNPYVFSHVSIGSIEMLALPGMALVAAFLVSRPGPWVFLGGFVALVITALANVPYGAMGFLLLGLGIVRLLCEAAADPAVRRASLLAAAGWTLTAGLAAAALYPYVAVLMTRMDTAPPPHPWPAAGLQREGRKMADILAGRRTMLDFSAADAALFAAHEIVDCSVSPADFHRVQAPWRPSGGAPSWLLLALLGVLGWRSGGRFWVACGALFLVLSLGPGTPLYRFLYDTIPGFHGMHRPYVFLVGAWLCLAALAALATRRVALSVPAGAVVAVGFVAGVRMLTITAPDAAIVDVTDLSPPAYSRVAARLGDFAVLEIPFMPLPMSASNARAQFWQKEHGKKLFNASLVRPPMWVDFNAFLRTQPFLMELARLQENPEHLPTATRASVETLRRVGFRYLLLHRAYDHESMYSENLRNALYSRRVSDFLMSHLGDPEIVGDVWMFDLRERGSGAAPRVSTAVAEVTRVGSQGLLAALPGRTPAREITLWLEGQGPAYVAVRDSGGRLLEGAYVQARPNMWTAARVTVSNGVASFVHIRPSGPLRIARLEVVGSQ
ncbi:MAG: hypothetical protein FJX76_14250 [Armatimonadetes bacterium]|nr:hypothetical protein [Armatimonadota bacterium]